MLPRAAAARVNAARSARPERSTSPANVNAAPRNAISGATVSAAGVTLAPSATLTPAAAISASATAVLRGRHASSPTARPARITWNISIINR